MASWKVIAILAILCFTFVGLTIADKWDESACDSRDYRTALTIRKSCDGFLPW